MAHAEEINTFWNDYLMKENNGLSHTLDQSFPNRAIRNYCMCDDAKIMNAKKSLKKALSNQWLIKNSALVNINGEKFCMMKCLNHVLSNYI